jgi:lipopolysaccharide/colanic/teichoic acid biosynthesis glycosyltransferase
LAHIQDGVLLTNIRVYSQDMWWMHLRYYQSQIIGWWGRVVKRLFDLITSFFWLITLSPILMIIWLLVYLQDRWPIFFWQKRVGKNWKDFWFVKFRSMKLEFCTWESDQNIQKALEFEQQLINSKRNARVWILPKIKDDPRVTKIWRYIRRLSLDELPSLWCVIIWDMSLIGPRPHLPREVAKYEERHRQLLTVKPWISWYAQIFWRDQLEFDREAKLDIYYVQNWSLWMDFYVMFATVW